MKKMILFVFLIVALLLSACGGAPTQVPAQVPAATENPVATQAPTEQGAPAGGAPVEVSFMVWGDPAELAVWQKIVKILKPPTPISRSMWKSPIGTRIGRS